MPSHFKVKEYCPLVFRNLRERFGVDDVEYRESLTRSQPVQIDSSGKSGAQFYRSYDQLFIIKSLTSEEIERMHAFLKHYHPVSVGSHLIRGQAAQASIKELNSIYIYIYLFSPVLVRVGAVCSSSSSVMETHCCRSIWACTV